MDLVNQTYISTFSTSQEAKVWPFEEEEHCWRTKNLEAQNGKETGKIVWSLKTLLGLLYLIDKKFFASYTS